MIVMGLDASTSIVGWAFAESGSILDAGFLNISKFETNRDKGSFVIETLNTHPLINDVHHINLEAALSGFCGGLTSQQTIITLSRWNAVFQYMLEDNYELPYEKPIVLLNVNTMRKKVLGAARKKGIKPKEYVKMRLPEIIPNLSKFEKLNRNKEWDAHNSDMYDAVVCALYG